jgi:N-formylglutamate amidohydrolase
MLDCHSMPSQQGERGGWPDFVLGDRFGVSCAHEITRLVLSFLKNLGYRVHLNKPYAGGYITEHYGRPRRGVHVLQIEIDRSGGERGDVREVGVVLGLQWNLSRLTGSLVQELPHWSGGYKMAA